MEGCMEVDKKTVTIALVSLGLALVWSIPSIRALRGADGISAGFLIALLIRTGIIFALIRFALFITKKK